MDVIVSKFLKCILYLVILVWALLGERAAAQNAGQNTGQATGQSGAALRGQVTDQSGGTVAGVTVLATAASGSPKAATTGKDGTFEISGVPAGTYKVEAMAKGFAVFTNPGVVLSPGEIARLNIQMTIQMQQQEIKVTESSPAQLDVNPANNANTIVLTGKDLDALSDDPDDLQAELQALAGPSAGPNGGQIYIDGFTGGQLPPKASIREIRINQNPFSAEYDKIGYGRIEIFTKPGTDKLHGQVMIIGNASDFNARNPFENLPAGTSPPAYHSVQYNGSIGGALGKKASFSFNIERRNIQDLSVVSATVLDPNFNIVPFSDAVTNPQTRTNLTPRFDYQLTPTNSITARYQYFRDNQIFNGIGQFNLPALGTDVLSTEHTFQITDTQIVSPTTINELRFQYVHENSLATPLTLGPMVNVSGAFNGNGSGSLTNSDVQNRYELQDIVYKNIGKHALKFGGRLRATKDVNTSTSNYNGVFVFGTQSVAGCVVQPPPAPQDACQKTPIQVYQTTEIGLSQGLTIPDIRAKYGYGGASNYTVNTGAPTSAITLVDAGLYVQDDWKVRPNVTVSLGLRFETQNNFSDKTDFAPRLGIAWGIGGNAKNPPKTVLRAGFGIFYDRFTYGLVLQQERLNGMGSGQAQILVQNPTFFLGCFAPGVPQTPKCPLPAATPSTIYETNPNLKAPYTIQTGVTLERQLTKTANVAVTYLNSRGVHQFFTNNLDPTTDPNSTAPLLFQYQSEGIFKQNQLILNGSIRMGTKLSLFGYYTFNHANSDTSGAGSFASNPLNLQQDFGRSSYDIRHRIFFGGTIGLPHSFRLSPFLIVSSGIPFNITSGIDPYNNNVFNFRPTFAASCATADKQTNFGCFNLGAPGPGYVPIPIYYGQGPGRFSMNLRVSKSFGFGPVLESAAGGAGMGGPSVGTFGRPGGMGGGRGGGGGRGADAGATNRKYSATLSVNFRNMFNYVNLGTPIGNLGSPLFGESNGLAGRPYGDSTSNRRIDLQLSFNF
jgi:hypothetical protein